MSRAELRRKQRETQKANTATYNLTKAQLNALVEQQIGDRIKQVKEQATYDAVNTAMVLLLTLAADTSVYTGVKEHVTNYRTNAKGADKKNILSNMLLQNSVLWSKDVCGVNIVEYDNVDFSLPYEKLGINSSATARQREIAVKAWLENNDLMFMYIRRTSNEIDLAPEEVQAFKALATYYPVTNISVNSGQLDGYTVFNYPISMQNGWNYVKQQLGDTRDYIYDMDAKAQDIDIQSAEAYVNSEYAVVLTELEV